MSFNFKDVELPKESEYLQPGHYNLAVTEVKFETPENKNPFVKVTFGGKSGVINCNFYVTPKAVERLQYAYYSYAGKMCDKNFESAEAVGAFFTKFFESVKEKGVKKGMVIGGKQMADGKVYGELPYKNFFLPDEVKFEEGPFEKGSANWMYFVKMDTSNPTRATDAAIVGIPANGTEKSDQFDDLPF